MYISCFASPLPNGLPFFIGITNKISLLRKVFFTAKTRRNRKVRKYKFIKINSLRSLRKSLANLTVKNLTFHIFNFLIPCVNAVFYLLFLLFI